MPRGVANGRPLTLRRFNNQLGFALFSLVSADFRAFAGPFLTSGLRAGRLCRSTKTAELSFRIVHFAHRRRTFLIRCGHSVNPLSHNRDIRAPPHSQFAKRNCPPARFAKPGDRLGRRANQASNRTELPLTFLR
jgi:hypothetical protein